MGSIFTEKTIAEVADVPSYATSLPVPNVQEMAEDSLVVPKRYIRNPEDMPQNLDLSHLSSEIPIIDLALLSKGNKEELCKLDLACKDWGFFQVVNHGVASEVLQNLKDASAEFFKLPLEEKNKWATLSDDIQGYGHTFVFSEEQILDWSDALVLVVYPSNYRKLKLWPTVPKNYKEIIEAYSSGIKEVGQKLLRSFSVIMGMEKDALLRMHESVLQTLRVNYYPACSSPDQVLGLSPHSDSSTMTILMQDDNVTGLQIQHQGGWVPVQPIPNALVINVGDVMEIWSNGKYKSIEHRAVTNENKARMSYASFFCPHEDVEIEPLDVVVDSQKSLKMYKKVKYGEYLRSSMKKQLEGKANIQNVKTEI